MTITTVSTAVGSQASLADYDLMLVTTTGSIATDASRAVGFTGIGATLLNSGLIVGNNSAAIQGTFARGSTITNHGTILGASAAIDFVHASQNGWWVTVHVNNTGTISAGFAGSGVAINLSSGGNTIANSGSISCRGNVAIQISTGYFGFGTTNNSITNSGLIEAHGEFGAPTIAIRSFADLENVVNSGTITGSILLGENDDRLTNTGTIFGSINMETGNDVIMNRGHIEGDVLMGDGSNSFDGRGGTVSGSVIGGAGSDIYRINDATITLVELSDPEDAVDSVFSSVSYILADYFEYLTLTGSAAINATGNSERNILYGNSAANVLSGLAGDDVMVGYAGSDVADGGVGNDSAVMGEGDDTAIGGGGNDSLSGENGDDLLKGGTGNDTLSGGDGDDRLWGNAGIDSLSGGLGADVFVYTRASDSPSTTFDRITDFAIADDMIDLSTLTATPLIWRGTAAYANGAPQVRITQGSNTSVYIDLNGDNITDMRLVLTGNLALTADHVLL